MYKVKRFSWFGLGKKSEPSKTKYTDQELKAKMDEVSKLLPSEYNKMLQAANDIAKFKNAHDYEYLYMDYAFPDFIINSEYDMARDLLEYPDKTEVKIASLSSYDTGWVYYDLVTKTWSWDDERVYGKLSSPIKPKFIKFLEGLRDSWLSNPSWFDEGELDDFKEFTDFVISTLKKRL